MRPGCSQGPPRRWTMASGSGGEFFSGLPQMEACWAWAPSPVPSPLCAAALLPPWTIPATPGQQGGWWLPVVSGTTGPHELVCSHSTAFPGEKKLPAKFPACQLVQGMSKELFLGNIDIKAEKKREQGQQRLINGHRAVLAKQGGCFSSCCWKGYAQPLPAANHYPKWS